jgi:hypothetical protein
VGSIVTEVALARFNNGGQSTFSKSAAPFTVFTVSVISSLVRKFGHYPKLH